MNLPLALTWGRIIAIPVFAVVFYMPFESANVLCTAIFFVAGITDWLDGYLARKWGQTSSFGAFLDPVADKLMVVVALILLTEYAASPWFSLPAVVIIGREITVSALREWMAELGERASVAVSTMGKIKTALQLWALGFLIYREPIGDFIVWDVGLVLLYASAALTLWSMIVYLRAAWPKLSNE
ncbi:MAG: CDP-diacylglycerol--glycerol-3-phosphate 3-phosphatidyltransferase [Gammaproteobacteria bacterium]|nr:CDP-diacylglycerol--glycerol-3-phosphate 3-phosphatidyltransferase [Gammaproteobacteria bacterium]